MSGHRLMKEEIVALKVLSDKGHSNVEIARVLGVTEGAVRYRKSKTENEPVKEKENRPFKAGKYEEVISHWMENQEDGRPPNVRVLYEHLVLHYGYTDSYKSVLRFVRARYPLPRIRTYRRVETPPGAQSQTDWGEFPGVSVGGELLNLSAFEMVLSHSRKPAVVWSIRKDQMSWHHCHNRAFRRLCGVAAVNRVDNVKTAISKGAGAWGEINPSYRAYAKAVGFHVDACAPRAGNAKGKVEAKVRLTRYLIDPQSREWASIEELQAETDRRIERWSERATCPATGRSVMDSWMSERERLAPLPSLPEPFDVVVWRKVRPDCMVSFENRQYSVPFAFAGLMVEVRGCAGQVQVLGGGRVLVTHPRATENRIVIDQACYEGEATDRVIPPPPLGRMGKRLSEIMAMAVQSRPIDLYAALAEVAR